MAPKANSTSGSTARASPRNTSGSQPPKDGVAVPSVASQSEKSTGKRAAGGGNVQNESRSSIVAQNQQPVRFDSTPPPNSLVASLPPIVNPFASEASHVSLAMLSAANLWQFVEANCPVGLHSFKNDWIGKMIDGPMLLRFHPSTFDREIAKEFPSLSVSNRVHLFNFVKRMVARDASASTGAVACIDLTLAKLWDRCLFDGPDPKILQFDSASTPSASAAFGSRSSFVFGKSPTLTSPEATTARETICEV